MAQDLRRGWLLGLLSPALDYRCAEPSRLIELLALADEQLLSALAGSRRATLTARYEQFDAERLPAPPGVETVCRRRRLARGLVIRHTTRIARS